MKKLIMIISASYFMFACTNASKNEVQNAKQMAIDSMTTQIQIKDAKQSVIDSMRLEAQIEAAKQFTLDSIQNAKTANAAKMSSSKSSSKNYSSYKAVDNQPDAVRVVHAKKKRKISRAAEGALIGAGVGAVSGAIISRNNKPGKGALIGGLVGAGLGGVTGVIIDKEQKKKGN